MTPEFQGAPREHTRRFLGGGWQINKDKSPRLFSELGWRAAVTEVMSQWTVLAPLQPSHQLRDAGGICSQQRWLQELWKVFLWAAKVGLEGKLNALCIYEREPFCLPRKIKI